MKQPYHLLLILLACCSVLHAHNLPSGFVVEENYVEGLDQPTDLTFAPDGRIFITEKSGNVRIVENGVLLAQPFYSVTTQVPNERGLDGIVLDPEFDSNGYVYLYYTLPFENKNIVARVTAAGNTAVPFSEIELLRLDAMYASWHNGGGMEFDTTGKLLIGVGDGNGHPWAQNMGITLGKIMRINKDGTIPLDNPFYAQGSGTTRAIAALGVRNPYTMAISKLTGKIFFNDVGAETAEEINEYIPGKNYGWIDVEGMIGNGVPPDSSYEDPIFAYDHQYGCAIVGATFYEPDVNLFPAEYFGKYFFMEYCEGKIMYMDPVTHVVTEFATDYNELTNNIEASNDGYLYTISIYDGILSRISYQGLNSPPLISLQPGSQTVAVGEDHSFSVKVTGDSLNYDWYQNGTLVQSGPKFSYNMFNLQLADDQTEIFVKVANPHGNVLSSTAVLTVIDGTRPTIQFRNVSPTYAAGDTIYFSAKAFDSDQESVPASDFTWRVDFVHDAHVHPGLAPVSGFESGTFFVETYGEVDTNVMYKVFLEVRDSSGLTAEKSVDVLPEKVTLQIQSQPAGAEMSIDGAKEVANFDLRSVKNLNRIVEASPYCMIGDSLYQFVRWENGDSSLSRTLVAQNEAISMKYRAVKKFFEGSPTEGILHVYKDTASSREYYKSKEVTDVWENWDILNPYFWDTPPFPNDYWSAVWEGNIVAPVSAVYTFHLYHDGKATLAVGEDVVVDAISSGGMQDDSGQVWLNGGDSLALQVDYDHYTYVARVELDWSYSIVERHPVQFEVPYHQVVEPEEVEENEPVEPAQGEILLFPNPSDGASVNICFQQKYLNNEEFDVEILDSAGKVCRSMEKVPIAGGYGPVPVADLSPGMYFFKVSIGSSLEVLTFLLR